MSAESAPAPRLAGSPQLAGIMSRLSARNAAFAERYAGVPAGIPANVFYCSGAKFKPELTAKMGDLALAQMRRYAPNWVVFAQAVGLNGADQLPAKPDEIETLVKSGPDMKDPVQRLAFLMHQGTERALQTDPFHMVVANFEDAYIPDVPTGETADLVEDRDAANSAREMARGVCEAAQAKASGRHPYRGLPRKFGVRIKSFNADTADRGARTADIFMTAFIEELRARQKEHFRFPTDDFFINLPKVMHVGQVEEFVELVAALEEMHGLEPGSIKIELMIEIPQCFIDDKGRNGLVPLIDAAGSRLVALHLGIYDLTSALGISSSHQSIDHPFIRRALEDLKFALADRPVWLSTGHSRVMVKEPHPGRDLTSRQTQENREHVLAVWREVFIDNINQLRLGIAMGWDLGPSQLILRWAANMAFYLEELPVVGRKLKSFVDDGSRPMIAGGVFADQANAQGFLNSVLRALHIGATTEQEVLELTGLRREELETRSFDKILKMVRIRKGVTLVQG